MKVILEYDRFRWQAIRAIVQVKLGFLTVLVHDCYQEEFQSMDIYSKGFPTKGLLADDTQKEAGRSSCRRHGCRCENVLAAYHSWLV